MLYSQLIVVTGQQQGASVNPPLLARGSTRGTCWHVDCSRLVLQKGNWWLCGWSATQPAELPAELDLQKAFHCNMQLHWCRALELNSLQKTANRGDFRLVNPKKDQASDAFTRIHHTTCITRWGCNSSITWSVEFALEILCKSQWSRLYSWQPVLLYHHDYRPQ